MELNATRFASFLSERDGILAHGRVRPTADARSLKQLPTSSKKKMHKEEISPIMKIGDVQPGDVVLCFSSSMRDARRGRESGYSHAAICIEPGQVLESAGGGVRHNALSDLVEEYEHLAVLRNAQAWDVDRLTMLRKFDSDVLGLPFNSAGLKQYEVKHEDALTTQLQRIQAYFTSKPHNQFSPGAALFCSELVVTAFIEAKIIGASAIAAFLPETFLPQDLANDMLFGFFIGYLIPYAKYSIPPGDFFENFANDTHFLRESRLN